MQRDEQQHDDVDRHEQRVALELGCQAAFCLGASLSFDGMPIARERLKAACDELDRASDDPCGWARAHEAACILVPTLRETWLARALGTARPVLPIELANAVSPSTAGRGAAWLYGQVTPALIKPRPGHQLPAEHHERGEAVVEAVQGYGMEVRSGQHLEAALAAVVIALRQAGAEQAAEETEATLGELSATRDALEPRSSREDDDAVRAVERFLHAGSVYSSMCVLLTRALRALIEARSEPRDDDRQSQPCGPRGAHRRPSSGPVVETEDISSWAHRFTRWARSNSVFTGPVGLRRCSSPSVGHRLVRAAPRSRRPRASAARSSARSGDSPDGEPSPGARCKRRPYHLPAGGDR